MKGFILGEKNSQSQQYSDEFERIPTTFVKTSSCRLIDILTKDSHGYFAVKLAFGNTKKIVKSQLGELKKAGIETPLHFLREFRLNDDAQKNIIVENNKKGLIYGETKIFVGEEVKPSIIFKKGDLVRVSGISKGKGFQGVVKRHHFAGGPKTHGQSDRERAPGSIGSTTTPGRVYKGKRMAGRMGGEKKTIRNMKIIEIKENGIVIKGLVPGALTGLLMIQSA